MNTSSTDRACPRGRIDLVLYAILVALAAVALTLAFPAKAWAADAGAIDASGENGAVLMAAVSSSQAAYAQVADANSGKVTASATSKNLKKRGAKFDLKNGHMVYSKRPLRGAGTVRYGLKVTRLKTTKMKNGKKKVTFRLTQTLEDKLSSNQKSKVLRELAKNRYIWRRMEASLQVFLVDYATGRNLLDSAYANGVKCKRVPTGAGSYTKKYKGSDGDYFYLSKKYSENITITFPAKYKNACFGVGYAAVVDSQLGSIENSFLKKRKSGCRYWQTCFFKKAKKNVHFMRLT